MGYVIVESTAHYTARVINYGPWNAQMRLKMIERRDSLFKSGIALQFKKRTRLQVGDSAILHVTWQPTRERFTEKCTMVKHTVHIEVNSCADSNGRSRVLTLEIYIQSW